MVSTSGSSGINYRGLRGSEFTLTRPVYGTHRLEAGASPPAPPKRGENHQRRCAPQGSGFRVRGSVQTDTWHLEPDTCLLAFSPRAPLSRLFAPGEYGIAYSAGTRGGFYSNEPCLPRVDVSDDGTNRLCALLRSDRYALRGYVLATPVERLRPSIQKN